MPWGDGTGPWGLGPMTGRAAGYCAGYPVPGYANPYVPGWGRGRGWWGGGRGWRWMYWATGLPGWARLGYVPYGYAPYAAPWGQPPTKEQEAEFLKDQQEFLREQMEEINKRLQELTAEEER
ncbi:MAG: hypothetical protein DRG50_00415 [Deltaproteobacteria bacterium]|nr:MAG: hypothetical protein DRG50_00415 [Deltaproteobacteria bacterium]